VIRTITVGQFVYAFFRPYGESGLLLALFVIFYLDATFFPTLPELFTVIIFLAMPKPEFGLLMLVTISIAEFSGITSLYFIVKYYDLPNWIKNKMVSYSKLFIVKDEKVILLNRIAPVIPFLGAFIATCRWPYAKSIFYNFLGGLSKYLLIILLATLLLSVFSNQLEAELITLAAIGTVIGISAYLSSRERKKLGVKAGF
jgi:membrane protein YqaA with SNARE-associated domain